VDGFVVGEVLVAVVSELVFREFGVLVAVGTVGPILHIPVPGFVVALLVGSRNWSVAEFFPLFVFCNFFVD